MWAQWNDMVTDGMTKLLVHVEHAQLVRQLGFRAAHGMET